MLVLLAAILFSLSLIALVGYNWEQIPAFIRTTLLLSTLLCTQIALYLCKDKSRIWSEFVGILSNFVLLANLALLSQIYHLGDDTASAFLGVAFVSLLVAHLNSGFHSDEDTREILSELVGYELDSSVWIMPPFYTDFGRGIKLGKGVFINTCCTFMDRGGIGIGVHRTKG